jgi:2-polyprenyl-3-methyl-5-hydroxy-6-metoxy-1,4-benzoquinol methylase
MPNLGTIKQMRKLDQRELFYNSFQGFEESLSAYDTARRVEVLTKDFLGPDRLRGKYALDVGAGLGFFSKAMRDLGADVLSTDLAPNLVEKIRERVGCAAVCADALALRNQFGEETFDIVLSSEAIEHTPDPNAALREMAAVLKPGGYLSLSTPNLLWYPVVRISTLLKARPFEGLENFSTFGSIGRTLSSCGLTIIEQRGLHLFPFQFGMHRLSRWADEHLQLARPLMINLCVLAQKTL